MKRIHHHGLEMIPILAQKPEFKILVQDTGLDRLSHWLETPNQQPAAVIPDIEMAIVVAERWHIAGDAINRLGQKIKVLARPERHICTGHGPDFAGPKPRAHGDGIAHHRPS